MTRPALEDIVAQAMAEVSFSQRDSLSDCALAMSRDLIVYRCVSQVTRPALEDIVAKAMAEEGDDVQLEEADFRDDPIAGIDLAEVLAGELRRFAAADAPRFAAAATYLTPTQAAALQRLG